MGRSGNQREHDGRAGPRYLLIADISGYTVFMADVEQQHGLDFSGGIPAAYPMLAALLDTVIRGLQLDFDLVKLEGDAVFAAAPADRLDGHGDRVLDELGTMYRAFVDSRTAAIPSSDHVCTACPAVANLDLKVIVHRGPAVQQTIGAGSDLLGPAVTIVHRLLKNTIRSRIGASPYLFLTDAAASGLGLAGVGLAHNERYADAGDVSGRIVELGDPIAERGA